VDCRCLGARVRLEAMAALVSTGARVSLDVRGRPDGLLGSLPIAGEPRGAGVAFIISELPGGRAEALWFPMAALVPTAGKFANQPT
jgi:hypothetical protein